MIEYKKECIKYDINNIIDIKETNLKNKDEKISKFEEIKYYNEILQIAEEYFKSEYYNTSKLDKHSQQQKMKKIKSILTLQQLILENVKIY